MVDSIDAALTATSVALEIAGAGLLVTIIAAPIVLALEVGSLFCRLLGVAGKLVSRRLSIKEKKHNEIRVLADSKLNTISEYVSAALSDGTITKHEFQLILSEVEKYHAMKDDIRTKTQKEILDEKTKISLIQQGKNQAREDLTKNLNV